MKYDFLNCEKATLTVMVQANNPERIKHLMDKAIPAGAEAFGIQFEQMLPEYRTPEVYRDLFSYAKGRPSYVTNYRGTQNNGKSDDELGDELVELAECGADLCDVMGDYFDRQPDEVAVDENAINKQIELNKAGKFCPLAMETSGHAAFKENYYLDDGAYLMTKIVILLAGADTMEQQLENLKIINMLKEKLSIPFLFLCNNRCKLLRRVGGEIGSCMYLCVYEHDSFSTLTQPLLSDVKLIRYLLNK